MKSLIYYLNEISIKESKSLRTRIKTNLKEFINNYLSCTSKYSNKTYDDLNLTIVKSIAVGDSGYRNTDDILKYLKENENKKCIVFFNDHNAWFDAYQLRVIFYENDYFSKEDNEIWFHSGISYDDLEKSFNNGVEKVEWPWLADGKNPYKKKSKDIFDNVYKKLEKFTEEEQNDKRKEELLNILNDLQKITIDD